MGMKLPQGVQDVLRTVAPVLAGALAGPFGGVASTVAASALDAWLGPAAKANADGTIVVPPGAIVEAVQRNAGHPDFMLALRQAEIDLEKYQQKMGLDFAVLEQKDRAGARTMAENTGIAKPLFYAGMTIVGMAMLMLFGVAIFAGMAATGNLDVTWNSTIAPIAFNTIGSIVSIFQAVAMAIIFFYFGSSKSSADKTDQMSDTMRDMGQALGEAARTAPVAPVAPVVIAPAPLPATDPDPVPSPGPGPSKPAVPAPSGMVLELLPKLIAPHRHFADGVSWALTPQGVSVEGGPAEATPGEPATVRTIWRRYGTLCQGAAKQYGVPIELIVATIATESRGDPSARRDEPKIKDASTGLMQTLRNTAREALGRRNLQHDDLLDPLTSILAGTAYIAQQRSSTHFDPPLVSAAYNAGSLKRDSADANRWKLLVYPTGTGRHIDTFVSWFGDCCRVSAEEGWGRPEGVPSFAACLAATSPK